MSIKLVLLLLVLSLSVNKVLAQFSVDADLRARTEYRDGARILLDDTMDPAFVSSQRTRLIVGFLDGNFELKMTVQNARIWGEDVERENVGNMNLGEGWMKYGFNESFSIKLGRQHLVFDDGRIFGRRNWNDISVSHDLAQAQYEKNGFILQGGGAYNNEFNNYQEVDYALIFYKYLLFFHANKKFDNGLTLSFLHSTDSNQDPVDFRKVYNRQTTGAYVAYKGGGKFGLQASTYFQYGKHSSGADLQANMLSIVPTYILSDKVRLAGGLNHFSGNDQLDNSGTNRSFNKLFGDGHRYYGYLDYFLEIDDNNGGVGVNEVFASVFFKTGLKTELEFSYHNFSVAGTLVDPAQIVPSKADSNYGSELDFQLIHQINTFINATFTYGTMFATPTMEIIKGGDSNRYQQWAMVMISAKPSLFKSDKNKPISENQK